MLMFIVPSVSCRMLCEQLNNKIRGYQLRGLCKVSLCFRIVYENKIKIFEKSRGIEQQQQQQQ